VKVKSNPHKKNKVAILVFMALEIDLQYNQRYNYNLPNSIPT